MQSCADGNQVESSSGMTLTSMNTTGEEQRSLWCSLKIQGNEITYFRLKNPSPRDVCLQKT